MKKEKTPKLAVTPVVQLDQPPSIIEDQSFDVMVDRVAFRERVKLKKTVVSQPVEAASRSDGSKILTNVTRSEFMIVNGRETTYVPISNVRQYWLD